VNKTSNEFEEKNDRYSSFTLFVVIDEFVVLFVVFVVFVVFVLFVLLFGFTGSGVLGCSGGTMHVFALRTNPSLHSSQVLTMAHSLQFSTLHVSLSQLPTPFLR